MLSNRLNTRTRRITKAATIKPARLPLAAAIAVGAAIHLAAPTPAAAAQSDQIEQRPPQSLVDDFIHFVTVANYPLAEANARALLERDLSPQEFVGIIEDAPRLADRFDEAYRRALLVPQLEDEAAVLWSIYEEGLRERARSPQRIAESIDLLDGNMRAQQLAKARLINAREYAAPQLFELLASGRDIRMRARAQRMLEDLGSAAVKPLIAALPTVNPQIQERIAMILGQVGNPLALPHLYTLSKNQNTSGAARAEAEAAIRRITGTLDSRVRAADLFAAQAQSFFTSRHRDDGGLVSFPNEEFQLLWSFEPAIGLQPQPIRTEVYHETAAMLAAEQALAADPEHRDALAIWIAANFARELSDTGTTPNPAYPEGEPNATFYATLAGAAATQDALNLALDDADTQLARAIIAALDSSIGGKSLSSDTEGPTPLVQALAYPDRNTRFEAALALARSAPTTAFTGSERVVPILSGFVREGGVRYAVVVADDLDRQQELRAALEDANFTVLPPRRNIQSASADIAETPGIDIILIDQAPELALDTAETVRNDPALRATPTLLFLALEDQARLRQRLSADPLASFSRPGISDNQIANAVNTAVFAASGLALTDNAAEDAALQALDALRELAISGNPVLVVNDAAPALIVALNETAGDVRLQVAEVLSYVCESRTQTALIDAALEAVDQDEQIALLAIAAEAVRRCGPRAEERQVARTSELLDQAEGPLANALAELAGALRDAGQQVVPVILNR